MHHGGTEGTEDDDLPRRSGARIELLKFLFLRALRSSVVPSSTTTGCEQAVAVELAPREVSFDRRLASLEPVQPQDLGTLSLGVFGALAVHFSRRRGRR